MAASEALFENAGKNTHNMALALVRATTPSGTVLDAPSGSGAFTRRLVDAGYEVFAGDITDHGTVDGATFARVNLNEPLAIDSASLDCITCVEGIEHLERPFDFVRECHRTLRDGGVLILTTPNGSALRSRWRFLLTGFHNKCKYMLDETSPNPLHHIYMLTFPELRYLLHTNGFEVERIETNRIKAVNWLYAPLALVQNLVTRWGIRRAKERDINRSLSREVLGQMMSKPLLFGESMIVAARKTGARPGGD